MATKAEIKRGLKEAAGNTCAGTITVTQFAKYMSLKDQGKAKRKYLNDLPHIKGSGKYFIDDVAQMLMERQTH
jgi:hypothetical protein